MTTEAPKFEFARLANTFEAFGMVMDLVSRHEPFMHFDLGMMSAALRLQLRHEHHVAAIAGKALVGYVGWLPTSGEIAAAWAKGEATLTPVLDRDVEAFALTIVLTAHPAITRPIIRAMRMRNLGKRAFFKRVYAGETAAPRKNAVLMTGAAPPNL